MRKPTVPEVLPIVRHYYAQGHGAGGCLHIVLDDDNVDDVSVRFCLDNPRQTRGPGGEVDEDGAWLCHVLLRMSRTQRLKLCRLKGPIVAADWAYSVAVACEELLEECER